MFNVVINVIEELKVRKIAAHSQVIRTTAAGRPGGLHR